jgi:hypothetical protein
MKKIIATILAVGGLAAYVNAQGTFTIDSGLNGGDGATPTSTSGGLVFLNGVLDIGTDINLAVFWGTSAGTTTTALNIDPGGSGGYWSLTINDTTGASAGSAPGAGDITDYANGAILDPNGNSYAVPTQAAGTTVWLEIEGWTGTATSYNAVTSSGATAGLRGTSIFSETLVSNSTVPQPDVHTMGSLNLTAVPEPTTLALAGLGGAALLAFRRRKA